LVLAKVQVSVARRLASLEGQWTTGRRRQENYPLSGIFVIRLDIPGIGRTLPEFIWIFLLSQRARFFTLDRMGTTKAHNRLMSTILEIVKVATIL